MTSLSPFSFNEISLDHLHGFLEMIRDYETEDPTTFDRWYKRANPWDAGEFRRFVETCEDERLDWRPKAGRISQTRYVLVNRETRQVCGNAVLRFPLNPEVESSGGNLTFDVPPRLRGQGFGTLTLNRLLFEAVRAGLARALVTCAVRNQPARRAIENNRGELDEEREDLARYWIRFR